jgi:hypothetical protein
MLPISPFAMLSATLPSKRVGSFNYKIISKKIKLEFSFFMVKEINGFKYLRDISNLLTKPNKIQFRDVMPVQENMACSRIVEPFKELDDGRFPGS